MRRVFAGIRDAFPDADETRVEVTRSTLHSLAALPASGRLPASLDRPATPGEPRSVTLARALSIHEVTALVLIAAGLILALVSLERRPSA